MEAGPVPGLSAFAYFASFAVTPGPIPLGSNPASEDWGFEPFKRRTRQLQATARQRPGFISHSPGAPCLSCDVRRDRLLRRNKGISTANELESTRISPAVASKRVERSHSRSLAFIRG